MLSLSPLVSLVSTTHHQQLRLFFIPTVSPACLSNTEGEAATQDGVKLSLWLVADPTAKIMLGLDMERGAHISEGDILDLHGA